MSLGPAISTATKHSHGIMGTLAPNLSMAATEKAPKLPLVPSNNFAITLRLESTTTPFTIEIALTYASQTRAQEQQTMRKRKKSTKIPFLPPPQSSVTILKPLQIPAQVSFLSHADETLRIRDPVKLRQVAHEIRVVLGGDELVVGVTAFPGGLV